MKIESSLITIDQAVQEGQKLAEGMKVLLPTGDDAQIYGFIAIESKYISTHIDMPPLGECRVFSNRVIFQLDKKLYRCPIFINVTIANENKYGLYLLYMPKFLHFLNEYEQKYYQESFCKENPNPKVARIPGIQLEEGVAYYEPSKGDLYFESHSKLRGIGSGFVVITRRVSKISGDIKYEVFDPYSVMIEK